MKSKIAVLVLAAICSAPAFAKPAAGCPSYLCGSSAVSPVPAAAGAHAVMWPPGPTAWGFVMQIFGA